MKMAGATEALELLTASEELCCTDTSEDTDSEDDVTAGADEDTAASLETTTEATLELTTALLLDTVSADLLDADEEKLCGGTTLRENAL